MPFKAIPPLYTVWQSMKNRCRQQSNPQWKDYGGRGISVCERWENSFQNFTADMGPRPPGYVLDRIDNDKGYFPENCRWVDRVTSQRNTRVVRKVVVEGVEHLVADIADQCGLKRDTIIERAAKGLSLAEIMAPEKKHNLSGLALGGLANGARNRAKTHCKKGHEFTEANTFVTPQGWRKCRRCAADRQNGYNRRKAE